MGSIITGKYCQAIPMVADEAITTETQTDQSFKTI